MTRDELAECARLMAIIPTESTKHMSQGERKDGILTMLGDLRRLAERDGCIAAAWAFEKLVAMHRPDDVLAIAECRSTPEDRAEVVRLRRMLQAISQTDDRTVSLVEFRLSSDEVVSLCVTAPHRETEQAVAIAVLAQLQNFLTTIAATAGTNAHPPEPPPTVSE